MRVSPGRSCAGRGAGVPCPASASFGCATRSVVGLGLFTSFGRACFRVRSHCFLSLFGSAPLPPWGGAFCDSVRVCYDWGCAVLFGGCNEEERRVFEELRGQEENIPMVPRWPFLRVHRFYVCFQRSTLREFRLVHFLAAVRQRDLCRLAKAFGTLALSLVLVVSLCFVPADRRGLVGVRRAYAIAGVDDLIVAGSLMGFLTVALAGSTFLGGQAATAEEKAEIEQQAYDEFSSAYSDSAQWLYDNSSTYVNETASGWQVDTSQIPDSVVSDIQSFAALEVSPSLSVGAVPSHFYDASGEGYAVSNGTGVSLTNISCEFDIVSNSDFANIVGLHPYLLIVRLASGMSNGVPTSLQTYAYVSDTPITFTHDSWPSGTGWASCYVQSDTGVYSVQVRDANGNSCAYYGLNQDVSFTGINSVYNGRCTVGMGRGCWLCQTQAWASSPVADSPSVISDAMADLQAAIANAEDTAAQLQAALDAVRAGNPQIAIPSDYTPTVINNYNEYVTYTTATPANPADVDTPSIDMGELSQAIADAVGNGATLADILEIISGWGVDTDMTDVISLLLNISGDIESDIERQERQAELDADLDEIIRLLTSINETLTGIARDMASLDRSTNDLVDLTTLESGVARLSTDIGALLSAVTGSHGADALGVYGRLDTILNWLDSYSPVDVSGIEQILRDWPDYPTFDDSSLLNAITGSHGVDLLGLFGRLDNILSWLDAFALPDLSTINHQLGDLVESDGETLTMHGLLHWINYYSQDVDRAVHDLVDLATVTVDGTTYGFADLLYNTWLDLLRLVGFSSVTADGHTYSFADLLYNIWLDLGQLCDDLVSWWAELLGRMDDVIDAIESLPHDGANPWPTEPVEPVGGPIIGPIETDPYGYPKMPDWTEYREPLQIPALEHALEELMQKFPFAMLNQLVQVAMYIKRPPLAPQFDVPAPNPSDWSDPYMVHVDLSEFDNVAATLRLGICVWAAVRISNKTIKMWMGDKAV